jgi:sec-independent protein translocase protein TatB
MLPDLSSTHILIVLVVALIVVGPKDLPKLLHRIGKFVGKMRGMANEFRASFDEMARQSELDELRKEVEAMRKASQAAIPQDLGIEAAMKSDAEAAYLANWEASHAAPTDSVAAEPSILPPPAETPAPKPAKTAKPKAAKTATQKTATQKTAARKPAKTEAVAEAAPKPRARKPTSKKSGADA